MEISKTLRGFDILQFKDQHGDWCSLQKSSIATEDCIWIGIDKPYLTVFQGNNKAQYVTMSMPENFSVNSRMHLNREQVGALLPFLQAFVETGELTK